GWRRRCSPYARNARRFSIPSPAPAQPSAPTGWLLQELPRRGRTGWAPAPSPIDLPEHDVERAEDGGDVREQMAAADEIHRLQTRKTGRADLALVRLVAAVGDRINAELALGRFDRGIDLAGRHVHALGVELEVMDQRFH